MCIDLKQDDNSFKCKNNLKSITHLFKDGKYYQNGQYFGEIVYSDSEIIQVECKNGNRYMQGLIITITNPFANQNNQDDYH